MIRPRAWVAERLRNQVAYEIAASHQALAGWNVSTARALVDRAQALIAAVARWLPELELTIRLGIDKTRFCSVPWVLNGTFGVVRSAAQADQEHRGVATATRPLPSPQGATQPRPTGDAQDLVPPRHHNRPRTADHASDGDTRRSRQIGSWCSHIIWAALAVLRSDVMCARVCR